MESPSIELNVDHWPPTTPAAYQKPWEQLVQGAGLGGIHCSPCWLEALATAFRHQPYVLSATQNGRTVGVLPLMHVKSLLFGHFLVSLPFVSWAGVVANDDMIATALVDRAVELADELDVRYLELRHRAELAHRALGQHMTNKALMMLPLAATSEPVWRQLSSHVRGQVRRGRKQGVIVEWGREELLADFYRVFSHNMRDLGTPVFGRRLFESILEKFPNDAELCVTRLDGNAIAVALVVHDSELTEVPCAASLLAYRTTAANSLMYWHCIERAIERGQSLFDFGRSTVDSGTFVFKKKWGARPEPLVWQYYVRQGSAKDMRPDNGKYDRLINVWRRLPVGVTRLIGPAIVRGIPS